MKKRVFDYYTELPAWAKGVVIVGGVAIVYFTTKQFLKRIRQQQEKKKANEVINIQKEETKNLENTGMRASFNDSQYKAWADKIVNTFQGCDYSVGIPALGIYADSTQVLMNIVKQLKNDVDFLKLQTAFGIRKYDQCGPFTGNVEGSLTYCVADELGDTEIKDVNKILASKGITYRF